MKKLLAILFIVSFAQQAYCQQKTLDEFNVKKEKINKNGFLVLEAGLQQILFMAV